MADDVSAQFTPEEATAYINSLAYTHNSAAAAFRIDDLATQAHAASASRGWYVDPKTGEPVKRNFGELIALMHSELSEALEAHRKDSPAKHIEGFTGVEEQFADALLRILEAACAMKLRLGEAFAAKCTYNLTREDHSTAARAAGGKKY